MLIDFFNDFLFQLQTDDLSTIDLPTAKLKAKAVKDSLLGMPIYDDDFWKMIIRFAINLTVLVVMIRLVYYPTSKRKDYLFTYMMIGFISFFICIALKNKDIDTGMALGLFAIFSIIRYRTDAIPIREMTYLFVVIGISVTNALTGKDSSLVGLLFINLTLLILVYGFERIWMLKHESSQLVIYEKIELIKPQKHQELIQDLEDRTGLKINRVSIGKIDFMRDIAQIMIYYYESDQRNISNYSASSGSDDGDD
ncbi:MAG TPA: DUF4956 domain-containing protein [Flavobacteriales bacterium]|nr:DUF4956 domain-containing protein [Flavobacteriales bacterium]HRE75457.1 DUF4956 domain-containing protein [Flavobacteriales bacterium]HRE96123.1 DUF4956 domain-containing protein [Flavobacteriales bacterium]HRJ34994.1 DUF4956 domain-containing protein [Flavobacteriales bacterium]HRJ37383.1 DUF4956 domain-containing protein [Flavobacteriales bacterium]